MQRTVAVVVALVAGLTLAGCQGTTSQAPTPVQSTDLTSSDGGFADDAVVGVVLRPGSDALATALADGLTDAGFRPRASVADAADPAGSQRAALRALVRAGAKALLVEPVDADSLRQEVQTAHDAGVVVVSVGASLPSSGTGGDGVSADYRVPETDSQTELVDRAVTTVQALQRGEKPTTD